VRARDSKHKADELAAVARWLREQADAMAEASAKLADLPALARQSVAYRQRADALREVADRLERGEHHDAR
jgi:hypothetical protein